MAFLNVLRALSSQFSKKNAKRGSLIDMIEQKYTFVEGSFDYVRGLLGLPSSV